MPNSGAFALAQEALRYVQVDPNESVRLASDAIRLAYDLGELQAASVAERALGLAAVHLQDLTSATRHLRTAMALAQRAGSAELTAEARMTFAFALNRSGKAEKAIREMSTALQDLGPVGHAQGLVQRAAILQQMGRLDEALGDYRAALPALRRGNDLVWVERLLLNRGVLHAFRHAYGAALRDLHEAEQLCEQLGLTLHAAFVHENLLLVHRRLGDVPTALEHLAAAEVIYHSLHAPAGSLQVERSELLLSVGLYREAREAAENAIGEFIRTGRRLSLPEARLLLARTAALDSDPDQAVVEARRAVREFSHQGRYEWLALAQSALVLARVERGDGKVSLRVLAETATRAEAAGWPATAADLRLLAGERGLHGRNKAGARHQLELVSGGRHRGTATRRAKAWYATALLRNDAKNPVGASAAAARGLQILDDYRNTMIATDLRARVSRLGVGMVRIGLANALQKQAPRQVLLWAERGRSRHLLERPALPPSDPELTQLMAELRGLVADGTEHHTTGRSAEALQSRQAVLERAIRDASRRGTGSTLVPSPPAPDDLSATLGDLALVEFVELNDQLHAVTVVDGHLALRHLGSCESVSDLVRWLPFSLLRLSRHRTSRASSTAALDLLRRIARDLDELLLRPLRQDLGDHPLVLVPTGVLQSLPWSRLPSLSGRPVTVAPSAAIWVAATKKPVAPGPVVVVAGPGLAGAHQEAIQVAAAYGVEPLIDQGATVLAVTSALPGASLLHLAAHGSVRADNPLFSSLQLADGPLTVYDLERVDQGVDTVVLAACDSGHDVILAGDELIGLSAAFLARTARHVVASVVPVPDAATRSLMTAFHELTAARVPVAEALARAQAGTDQTDPSAIAAAAGFVCIGAGFSPMAPVI